MTITPEQLRASAAETRAKVALVRSDPMIYPPLLDEMLRSAGTVDEAAAEVEMLAGVLRQIATTNGSRDQLQAIARATLEKPHD